MGLLEDLGRKDYLAPLVRRINEGSLVLKGDKLYLGDSINNSSPELVWLFGRMAPDRNCYRWFRIYLANFHFIPRECFGCWKVVVKPRTLTQLLKIYEYQQKHKTIGKCGIETRPFATYKGWYSAFWYCPLGEGLAKAKEIHTEVETMIRLNIGMDVPVILKRACTEMEEEFGPSENWVYPPAVDKMQDALDEFLEVKTQFMKQPPMYHNHIKLLWLKHAFEKGDPTAADHCDNFPRSFGVQPTTTYHGKKVEIADRRGVDGVSKIQRI